ncbi:unnamed protein product [Trichobilharzia szidati]|nr:unnamed protein product [Trichobilharzia szidati]
MEYCSVDLKLKLYAAAIQNAHILAGEMDLANLQLAFKMTSELQQRVIDLMRKQERHLKNLEAFMNIKKEDTYPAGVMEIDKEVSQSMETDMDARHNHYDESQNSEVIGSENIENGEAINDNQHLCELSNHVVNNTVPTNSQTSSICETLTPSTSTSEEAWKPLSQKHKLRSIESLCEVMLLDGIPIPFTNENTDCVACKLRNHVQTETSNDKLDNRRRKRGRRQRNKNTRDDETSTSSKGEEVDADSKNDPFASHPLVKLQAKRRQCLSSIHSIHSRPTLLQMLLAEDIRKERNQLMQCIRYIVNENFFQE